jgi:hypothetical protein
VVAAGSPDIKTAIENMRKRHCWLMGRDFWHGDSTSAPTPSPQERGLLFFFVLNQNARGVLVENKVIDL